MRKKLFIGILVAMFVGMGVFIVFTHGSKPGTVNTNRVAPDDSTPMTVQEKKNNPPAPMAACLVKSEQVKREDEDPVATALA